MSKTKDMLLEREKELQNALMQLKPLQDELKEVQRALKALNPKYKEPEPLCSGCNNGCDECRQGWRYR